MGPEALLRAACELAYVVARNGAEDEAPVDPPAAMRSFLYVADLSERALAVAQQAIEDDPAFRRRVADQAEEKLVRRAGILWLTRPIGWAAEFETLRDEAGDGRPEIVEAVPVFVESSNGEEGFDVMSDDGGPNGEVDSDPFGLGTSGDVDDFSRAGARSEQNAIEDELSSLRGLVDRLSTERQSVSGPARRNEQDLVSARNQPAMFESDVYTLQSELDAARNELDAAREERDRAVRQHSESLTRQLELEKELERSRELRAEIELEHSEVDAGIVEVRETLARTEAALTNLESEHNDLRTRQETTSTERDDLQARLSTLIEDNASQTRTLQAEVDRLRDESEGLRSENLTLESNAEISAQNLSDTTVELGQASSQATEARALVEALTEEKIDLASRLADTESMLETNRTQLAAVRSDSETIAAELSSTTSHRDGLAVQVDELHGSLAEALSDLAKVRSTSDADRAALKDVRQERDLLRVRVGSLEQIETGLEAKLATLATERDKLASVGDQAQADIAQLESRVTEASADRDRLEQELATAKAQVQEATAERESLESSLESLRATSAEFETGRDGLAQQVTQLTEENSAIQGQLVESERARVEASENQGNALSELAHRLSLVETERGRLERELQDSDGRLSEALTALDSAQTALVTADAKQQGETSTSFADSSSAASEPVQAPAPSFSERDSAAVTPSLDEPTDVPAAVFAADTVTLPPLADDSHGSTGEAEPDPVVSEEVTAVAPASPKLDRKPPSKADPADFGGGAADAQVKSDPDQGDDDANRAGKRHVWGLGPLLRGENGRATRDEEISGSEEKNADPAEGTDDIQVVISDKLKEIGNPTEAVADGEIDNVQAELTRALGSSDDDDEDDDDLDALSDLISQTVTGFNPVETASAELDSDNSADAPSTAGPTKTRRLFANREEQTWGSISADATGENEAIMPPSVFDGVDPTGPLASSPLGDAESDTEAPDLASMFGPSGVDAMEAPTNGSGSGRRTITIPAEIMNDEVEYARHVVSSPDVVLLVDGDSVAKMGWPSLPAAQQRDALVSYLTDLSASSGAAPDVVFDGRVGEEESLPSSRAVRIRLSTPPTEPAAALDELVDAYPEQWPIAVVTDDDELGRSAVERGAVVLNNGQLLDLFIGE